MLGHRPVSPRTYLAARLAVLMASQGIAAALIAGPSVLLCGFRFGWPAAAGLLLAAFLLALLVALVLISVYAGLVGKLRGRWLSRALISVQVVLAGLYMALLLFQDRALAGLAEIGPGPEGWLLALPTAWFAGLAAMGAGELTGGVWICLAGVVGSIGGLGWFARDKIPLNSARNLGRMQDQGAERRTARLKPAGRGEALGRIGAVATLIRAQFRHDMQLKMGAVGLLPVFGIVFLVAFQTTGTLDPFVPGASKLGLGSINFGVLAISFMIFEQLYASESYRAGWIFFATPADRARLAAQTRYCVTLFLFLPCLTFAAICFAWRFEAVWHGLVHVFLLGCLGILAMQTSQFVWPRLPFTRPLNRARAMLPIFVQLLGVGVISSLLALYAPFAYARPPWAIGTFAAAALAVVLMERILPARLNRKLRWLESEG